MARYRKGNKYLSEEEYRKHVDGNWAFGLFLLGAIATGYLVNESLNGFDFPKLLRFIVVIVSGVVGGFVAARVQRQVRLLIVVLIFGGVVVLIGSGVWSIL